MSAKALANERQHYKLSTHLFVLRATSRAFPVALISSADSLQCLPFVVFVFTLYISFQSFFEGITRSTVSNRHALRVSVHRSLYGQLGKGEIRLCLSFPSSALISDYLCSHLLRNAFLVEINIAIAFSLLDEFKLLFCISTHMEHQIFLVVTCGRFMVLTSKEATNAHAIAILK